jgi:hypothetical protein
LFSFCTVAFAQSIEYNHPELEWVTFETEHFVIHHTVGLEDVADLAARIAEEIHDPLCNLYNYRPDTKVSLIFQDTDDIANAASYFQSNKIKFWVTSMNWDFRGTHNWLRNVVTHEYTHMIQLGASRKWTRHIPAFYGQVIGYEKERRPDVLYGYPNTLISWPLPSVTVPGWFAEGTAQFQFNGNGYDFWDSHRDMLLRQSTLSNRLLSFEDMGYFGKTSLESEGVYNQGFSFTKYIADHSGGGEVLSEITRHLSSPLPVSMDDAIKEATGRRGVDWYDDWTTWLNDHYGSIRSRLQPYFTKADTLENTGFVNLFPRLSPDGNAVAFISNQNRDYFGQSSLYLHDFVKNEVKILDGGANGALAWLPDGSGIIFSRRAANKSGSLVHDLFLYRIADEKTIRLSKGLRSESVDVSPDGKLLVFTVNNAGKREIGIAAMPDLSAKKTDLITDDNLLYRHPSLPHEQYYIPRWSPDGNKIAVAHHLLEGRGIRIFEYNHEQNELTLQDEFDGEGIELRDPTWDSDGKNLIVSWDESGISNIYRLDTDSGEKARLTVVLGGALYPDIRNNRMVFSEFCEDGFRILAVVDPQPVRAPRGSLDIALDDQIPYIERIPPRQFSLAAPTHERQAYRPAFEKLYWFPRIAFDYGTFKPGVYLLLNDILDELTFIGGFAVNQKRDYDLYALAEYRAFYPTIFAEYFNVQRRLTSHFADSSRIVGEEWIDNMLQPIYDTYRIRYRYNLNEINVGLGLPFGPKASLKTRAVYDQYVAHNRFDDESSVSLTYFKGWSWKLGYYMDYSLPGVDSQINPRGGYKGFLEYTRANHDFIKDIEIGGDAVGLREIYDPNNYDMVELGFEKYFPSPIKSHTIEARVRGGFMGEPVDPFFYLYAGGLPGMRGYSFYSMGGERIGVGTLTYRFPIVKRAAWNLWPLSVNRIYGSFFSDVGDAWNGDFASENLKKDIGAGLRMQMHSFYLYPTAVSFDVAYGLDKFDYIENDIKTSYGEELRYYFTVLFDFYTPIIPPARQHGQSCGCSMCR